MRRLFLTTILVVLMASPAAIAQTGSTNSLSEKQTPWPAPVGHRQPRMDQVPSEKDLNNPNSASNRDDAALDRKIKSICRGC